MAATPHRIVSVHLLDAAGRLLRVLFLDREGHFTSQPYYLPREVALILAANQQRGSGLRPGWRCSEAPAPQGIDPSVLSACTVAVTTQAPHHARHPWVAAGAGTPAVLGVKRLLFPASGYRDVLAGCGVDAFEGPALGVEVPEVARHGGGASTDRVPGGG